MLRYMPLPICCAALLLVPRGAHGQPNYAFLACESGDKILRMSLDEEGYPIDEADYADAGDGLSRPLAMAFHPDPQDPEYPDTDHLYVAGDGGGKIVKIVIDRATGDKVASVELGAAPAYLRSLAFQPGTHRLYAGALQHIYRYSADVSGYESLVDNIDFYDECRLAFHPRTGELYVTTGFDNHVMVYDPATGGHLRNLTSYDGATWFLSHGILFDHLGGDWQLHVAAIRDYGSNSYFSNLRLDPDGDVLLGVEADKQLSWLWNMDKSWPTGNYYSGVMDYPMVREISPDFGTVTLIKPMGHPQLPSRWHITISTWPPRPLDTDADCIPDASENAWGLNPGLTDTDGDGVLDGAEVGYDGDYGDYDPHPSGNDTDATKADTDGGGEEDGDEIDRGRDPLDPGDDDNDEDGVPNLLEDSAGSDRDDPDSDDDGLTDYEEIAWNGDGTEYTPYPAASPDTNPNQADTDGDGFSDLVEMAGGSDPLAEGWTAAGMLIRMSFQPTGSTRAAGFALDEGWLYSDGRGYGWQ